MVELATPCTRGAALTAGLRTHQRRQRQIAASNDLEASASVLADFVHALSEFQALLGHGSEVPVHCMASQWRPTALRNTSVIGTFCFATSRFAIHWNHRFCGRECKLVRWSSLHAPFTVARSWHATHRAMAMAHIFVAMSTSGALHAR